jgi:hypothetical protein
MASIVERGLSDLIERMKYYNDKRIAAVNLVMQAALLTLWESVPPYPAPPEGSTYERTGMLGKSLGSGEGGGKVGSSPDIFEVTAGAGGMFEGHFGTNIEYAEYVIGDDTQAAHMGYWWQMKDVADRATDKIHRLFQDLGTQMANFIEGHGG